MHLKVAASGDKQVIVISSESYHVSHMYILTKLEQKKV